jgi:exopolyphosphatase/guanosine-5'-triphosphate,3'-diphosphate pyrophosphatase
LNEKKKVFEQQFKLQVIPKLSTQIQRSADPFEAAV